MSDDLDPGDVVQNKIAELQNFSSPITTRTIFEIPPGFIIFNKILQPLHHVAFASSLRSQVTVVKS